MAQQSNAVNVVIHDANGKGTLSNCNFTFDNCYYDGIRNAFE